MIGYAAASSLATGAYVPPAGQAAVQVGSATYHFLQAPFSVSVWEFAGIAFIVFVVARHWGMFVNKL